MTEQNLFVIGRFPPPRDGQAIATQRLADLLAGPGSPFSDVIHADTGVPEGERLALPGRSLVQRSHHLIKIRRRLRDALVGRAAGPILWPAVSPSIGGHLRDRLAILPSIPTRWPLLGVVHRGDFADLFASPVTRRSAARMVERVDAFVFLTRHLADQCAGAIPAGKRLVVPNTVDAASVPTPEEIAVARERRAERRRSGGALQVLFLSGMIESKGYHDVLRATAVLRDRGVPVQTRFVGRWPSLAAERAFRAEIDRLGLETHVTVFGGISDPQRLRTLLLEADALALPTTYPVEAQPLVVIEALASGTPVVVTPHAGLPEMITEGQEGLLVPPADPPALADALVTLCAPGTWRRHSSAARARFDRLYAPEVVRERWLEVLRPWTNRPSFS